MGLFTKQRGMIQASGFQASKMGLFYMRVNVKALVTGSITKWSPNSTSWHDRLGANQYNGGIFLCPARVPLGGLQTSGMGVFYILV
jgi:hypothetical protein